MKLKIEIECNKCLQLYEEIYNEEMNLEGYTYLKCSKCGHEITFKASWE